MAFGKTATKLTTTRDRLIAARQQAGEGASGLRKDIDGLLAEVDDMLRQLFPEKHRIEEICAEAETKIRSAPDLGKLTARANKAAADLMAERDALEKLDDHGVSSKGCERVDEWLGQLRAIVSRAAGHPDQSSGAQMEIDRISVVAKRQREGAFKILEASELIDGVGKGPRTAALDVELGKFRELFLRQEPAPQQIEGFERELAVVRKVANTPAPPPPPPPASLNELRKLMPEARRWVEAVGADPAPLGALEDRLTRAEAAPNPAQADALRDDVKAFVTTVRAQARQEYDTRFLELSADVRYYEEACGQDRQMEVLVEKLRGLQVEQTDPPTFESWREQFGKARIHFDGLAKAGAAMLERLRHEKVQTCVARLALVMGRNLMDEVRRGCDNLKVQLDQLGSGRAPEAMLSDLRTAGRIQDETEKLDRQSSDDLESYARSRDAARGSKRELEEMSQRARVPLMAIRDLDVPAQLSLGKCRELLDGFLEDLKRASDHFVRTCHETSMQDCAFCEYAESVLKGSPGVLTPTTRKPEVPADPTSAASQRTEYAAFREEIARTLDRESALLHDKVKQVRAALAEWRGDRADVMEARGLIDDIDSGGYDSEPDPIERLRSLGEMHSRCENFFHRMERDRREAEAKLKRIRQKWRHFTERDLKTYYPEYSNRITGLLMGIPESPLDWKAVNQQIDEITAILLQLEPVAMRRAAAEIDDIVRVLERRLPTAPPEKRREIQAVLDAVEGSGSVSFPDSNTRRKLRNLREDLA